MSGSRTHSGAHGIRWVEALLRHGVPWPAVAAAGHIIPAVRLLVLVPLLLSMAGRPLAAASAEPTPLRFGFSSQVLADVNEGDARASLKAWSMTLGSAMEVAANPKMEVFTSTDAIKEALLTGTIDAVTITAVEYWTLRRDVPLGTIILGRSHGEITEEYLLLVNRDNPAIRVADLRGKHVAILTTYRASLAAIWLETLLLEEHLGTAATFWGKTTRSGKLSRVILPVFFRQGDACVVTREGFRTMTELNPQVGQQLRILAQSPPLVPTLFGFRADLISKYRDNLLAAIGQLGGSPAGRQTLTLFQAGHLEERPVSDLDPACALLDRHQRLLAAANDAANTHPAGAVTPGQGKMGR